MPDRPQLVIGVLASGRGSNFEAIAGAVASGAIHGALAVLYPEAIRLYAEGRIRLEGRRVHIRETA